MSQVTKNRTLHDLRDMGSSCKGIVTRLELLLGSDQQQDRGDYVLQSPVPRASQGQEKMAWDFPVPQATISVFYQWFWQKTETVA